MSVQRSAHSSPRRRAGPHRQCEKDAPLGGAGAGLGQQRLHLIVGRDDEHPLAKGWGLSPGGGVGLDPAPPHRLGESRRDDRVVAPDSRRGQCPLPPLARAELAVQLVEVPGREVTERHVPELGGEDRVDRPPGLLKGPRRPAPGLGVLDPLVQGRGHGGARAVLGLGAGLAPEVLEERLRHRPILRPDDPGDLAGVAGDRVGPGEEPQAELPRSQVLDASGTVGPALACVAARAHGEIIGSI